MDLDIIRVFVTDQLADDHTGHDMQHINRVAGNAHHIAVKEGQVDQLEVITASALLHDIIDDKLVDDTDKATRQVADILVVSGARASEREEVMAIISHQSFSKNISERQTLSPAGEIVQDADRLDAIGAIGIARAFHFGGTKGHALYNEDAPRDFSQMTEANYRNSGSTVNHFYEKLLRLKDLMNTSTGRNLAQKRTEFMRTFLDQLYHEIDEGK